MADYPANAGVDEYVAFRADYIHKSLESFIEALMNLPVH